MTDPKVTIDIAFPASYEVEIVDETLNDTEPRYYYPGARRDGGKDGLLIAVSDKTGRWMGVFEFGDSPNVLLSGVFATPAADVLCVVASGKGYLVHSDKPEWWSEIHAFPITTVLQAPEVELLIVANFTSIYAFGKDGLAWKSKRLVWDDLRITSYDRHTLCGDGFDPTQSARVAFAVDLRTGEHEGGSFPRNS